MQPAITGSTDTASRQVAERLLHESSAPLSLRRRIAHAVVHPGPHPLAADQMSQQVARALLAAAAGAVDLDELVTDHDPDTLQNVAANPNLTEQQRLTLALNPATPWAAVRKAAVGITSTESRTSLLAAKHDPERVGALLALFGPRTARATLTTAGDTRPERADTLTAVLAAVLAALAGEDANRPAWQARDQQQEWDALFAEQPADVLTCLSWPVLRVTAATPGWPHTQQAIAALLTSALAAPGAAAMFAHVEDTATASLADLLAAASAAATSAADR